MEVTAVQSQFLPRERLRLSPEVHVVGLCLAPGGRSLRILVARRSAEREFFPGLLEGCGGQLAPNESFEEGVQRHFKLELGLAVRVLTDIHCFYQIRQPDKPLIPGIRFLCELVGDAPAQINSPNHSKVWWVTESELRRLPAEEFIPGLRREALDLIQKYKQQKSK